MTASPHHRHPYYIRLLFFLLLCTRLRLPRHAIASPCHRRRHRRSALRRHRLFKKINLHWIRFPWEIFSDKVLFCMHRSAKNKIRPCTFPGKTLCPQEYLKLVALCPYPCPNTRTVSGDGAITFRTHARTTLSDCVAGGYTTEKQRHRETETVSRAARVVPNATMSNNIGIGISLPGSSSQRLRRRLRWLIQRKGTLSLFLVQSSEPDQKMQGVPSGVTRCALASILAILVLLAPTGFSLVLAGSAAGSRRWSLPNHI